MQLFPCPFCGLRSEAEFHFGGDSGNARPEGQSAAETATWTDYLYFRRNSRGPASEVWMHMTCGEVFRMDRDTLTHKVSGSAPLSHGGEHVRAAS
ncbi:MAG: sarcosine oxidase subunit delta [Methylorubrum populi]